VAETTDQRIVRVDPETGSQTVISTGTFLGPEFVLEDPANGTLLVSDFAGSTPQGIYRIDAGTGAVLESCTGVPFGDPRQMVLSEDGDTLWVVDSGPNRLFEIDLTTGLNFCSPVQIGGGMGDAWGVALDPNGDLIVASRNEGLFQYVDPDTGVQTVINESPDILRPHEIVLLPEPASLPMLVIGIGALLALGCRRASR
jgi:sugar lactone lactonase YvrE